jgi:hypothetical protein
MPSSSSLKQTYSTLKKNSTAKFASAVAALSRPLANAVPSSPPSESRSDDLSTSAPTSEITWGTTTLYSGNDPDRRDTLKIYDSDSPYERLDDDTRYEPHKARITELYASGKQYAEIRAALYSEAQFFVRYFTLETYGQ